MQHFLKTPLTSFWLWWYTLHDYAGALCWTTFKNCCVQVLNIKSSVLCTVYLRYFLGTSRFLRRKRRAPPLLWSKWSSADEGHYMTNRTRQQSVWIWKQGKKDGTSCSLVTVWDKVWGVWNSFSAAVWVLGRDIVIENVAQVQLFWN